MIPAAVAGSVLGVAAAGALDGASDVYRIRGIHTRAPAPLNSSEEAKRWQSS